MPRCTNMHFTQCPGHAAANKSCVTVERAGNKSEAKTLMAEAGVPVVPGYHGHDQSLPRSPSP